MRIGKKQVIGTLKADEFVKIYDSGELGSAVSSVTISGLDGNTDEVYKAVIRGVGGAASHIYLKPNNDGGSNYGYQYLYGLDSSAAAGRGTNTAIQCTISALALNKLGLVTCLIHAKSGYVRTFFVEDADQISGAAINSVGLWGQSWNNTADNITSLVIAANDAGVNGFGIGSRIELYAKRVST